MAPEIHDEIRRRRFNQWAAELAETGYEPVLLVVLGRDERGPDLELVRAAGLPIDLAKELIAALYIKLRAESNAARAARQWLKENPEPSEPYASPDPQTAPLEARPTSPPHRASAAH